MNPAPPINFPDVIKKFDKILARGLCEGVGQRDGQMCIEAAICAALDLPHGDNPTCVSPAIIRFKIGLNDAMWSSPQARAAGLRDLGIAQIGSKGVVDDMEFVRALSEQTIRRLIPALCRELFPHNEKLLETALTCEKSGAAWAAGAAAWAAEAAGAAEAAEAARAAAWAATRAAEAATRAAEAAWAAEAATRAAGVYDKYLLLSADICLGVLKDLKSPGCQWL